MLVQSVSAGVEVDVEVELVEVLGRVVKVDEVVGGTWVVVVVDSVEVSVDVDVDVAGIRVSVTSTEVDGLDDAIG